MTETDLLNSPSYAEAAYVKLKSAIQEGVLKPHARLTEAELAKFLGMSRTPIRQALQRLETEGLAIYKDRQGLSVAALDRQAIAELYAAREILEGAAAASSARHATEFEIESIRLLIDAAGRILSDWKALQALNQRFHFAIYDTCHNRYLVKMRNLHYSVHIPGRSPLEDVDAAKVHYEQHVAIFEAIRSRDAVLAKSIAESHVRYALQQRLQFVEEVL
jgi:DNA-binding GntR family transcriptional regulator